MAPGLQRGGKKKTITEMSLGKYWFRLRKEGKTVQLSKVEISISPTANPKMKRSPFGAGDRGVRSRPPNQDAHKLILRSIFQRGNAIKKGEEISKQH